MIRFNVTSYFGFKAEYRGLVYKAPDFKLSSLNPDKVTHPTTFRRNLFPILTFPSCSLSAPRRG